MDKAGGGRQVETGLLGVERKALDAVRPDLLGFKPLDLAEPPEPIGAICAAFDLAGFTDFSSLEDARQRVPAFLSDFLDWLFQSLRTLLPYQTTEKLDDFVTLHAPLPFYAKFMGDGVLLLFETAGVPSIAQHNLVLILEYICGQYREDFIKRPGADAPRPPALRCGVAKGDVFPMGAGREFRDFWGPCINMACRLQKVAGLSFCAATQAGFDFPGYLKTHDDASRFHLCSVPIRGFQRPRTVLVLKSEFDGLSPGDRGSFGSA